MEGVDISHLGLGPPGGTGEVFERIIYAGLPAGQRKARWVVQTTSGWTASLEQVRQWDREMAAIIRAQIAGQAYGVYSPP